MTESINKSDKFQADFESFKFCHQQDTKKLFAEYNAVDGLANMLKDPNFKNNLQEQATKKINEFCTKEKYAPGIDGFDHTYFNDYLPSVFFKKLHHIGDECIKQHFKFFASSAAPQEDEQRAIFDNIYYNFPLGAEDLIDEALEDMPFPDAKKLTMMIDSLEDELSIELCNIEVSADGS